MDDTPPVREMNGFGQGYDQLSGFMHGESLSLQLLLQTTAFDKLHGQEFAAVLVADLMDEEKTGETYESGQRVPPPSPRDASPRFSATKALISSAAMRRVGRQSNICWAPLETLP